ncbi:PAS domain S-box protein [Phormidium nigroviride]
MSAELLHQLTILRDRVAELETQLATSQKAKSALRQSKTELEKALEERTDQLQQSVAQLQQEILDRQLAEENLKKQERQIKSLLNNIPHIAWLKDPESKYIAVNEPFARACGLTPEDIVDKTDFDLWPSELAAKYREDDFQVIVSGQQKVVEELVVDALGNTSWVETIKTPIYSEGKIIGTTGFAQDITVRKQAEINLRELNEELEARIEERTAALQQSESRLLTLLSSAPLILFGIDRQGRFTFSEGKGLEAIGLQPGELVGQVVWEVYRDIPETIDSINRALAGEKVKGVITELADAVYESQLSPVRNATGEVIGMVGVSTEISDVYDELRLRKQVEQQLQQQAQFLQGIWDGVDYGIFVLDVLDGGADFRYVRFNPAMERITLVPIELLLGKTISEALSTDMATLYCQYFAEAIRYRKTISFEERFYINSDETWWLLNVTPLRDDNSQIHQLVVTATNITNSKAAEIALQESESKYRSLVDTSQDMIWSVDLEGRYTFVNPAVKKIYGYEPEEMIGRQFTDFLPPQQIQKDFEAFTCVLAGEALLQYESIQIAKDGRLINLIFNAIALRGEAGNILGATGIASDISLRKLAESALAESEAKFRRLVENANDLIYEHSIDSIFTYLSPKISDLIGYEISELLGKSFVPLIYPQDLPAVTAVLNCIIETGEKQAGLELRAQHKDGSWHWITCNISPVKDANGNIISFMGIARDIRDRKIVEETLRHSESQLRQQALDLELALRQLQRTQSQLIQSEKMSSLGQLVAGVAHEINNPVNFIYGNLTYANDYTQNLLKLLQLYQKHYSEPVTEIQEEIEASDIEFLLEDLPKILSSMKVGAERIQQIVTSLRTFSRMDEAEMKEVNIHEGIDSTLMILQHRIKAKSDRPAINIIKEYGKLPLVECSAGQLNQVFMNILSNALDALDERDAQRSINEMEQMPSSISIYTQVSNANYVEIRIIDNGPGIQKSVRERLFDPFFTTKAVGKGTGMGLSISYQIITERHGGTLECISTPGEGAEFKVMIPLRPS